MDPTPHYYAQFATEFFGATVGVDMSPIHQRFQALLPPGAHILDAGCGSGRDARAFADAGFQVTAFDASAELARLASAHCGFAVAVRRFDEVNEVAHYDGIWCCATAAVPAAQLVDATEQDWAEEYLAPIISIRVVDGLDASIAHINHYGSHHTDAPPPWTTWRACPSHLPEGRAA